MRDKDVDDVDCLELELRLLVWSEVGPVVLDFVVERAEELAGF